MTSYRFFITSSWSFCCRRFERGNSSQSRSRQKIRAVLSLMDWVDWVVGVGWEVGLRVLMRTQSSFRTKLLSSWGIRST